MYVCLYLYVYLFYYVYCVPCTANRKPVCHFTCGLLTFTEARAGSDNSAPPAPGLQARRRIPWGCAMPVPPPLPRGIPAAQRLSVRRRGPCPVHAVRTVRTPIRQQRKRRCMPCRCMPNPPFEPETAPGMYARRTICKHVANTLQTTGAGVTPSKQYPETVQKLRKCPPSKASEDALRRTKCTN